MSVYLPYGENANTNISNADRARYFDAEEGAKGSTHWKLKDGYEVRALSKGEKPSKLNSLATYTNDFDDLHDEYDANLDRENFGIFKTYARPAPTDPVSPTTTTTPEPAAVETPVEPDTPVVPSERRESAIERVARWENPEDPEYHNYTNRRFSPDSAQAEYDFSGDRFVNASNQAPEETNTEANDLLNRYKNNLIG